MEGLTVSGSELEKITLTLENGQASFSVGYYGLIDTPTQEQMEEYEANGYYIDDQGNWNYEVTKAANGKYYATMHFGAFGEGTYVESSDSVTVRLDTMGVESVTVLTKSGDDACRVKSVEGLIVDELVTEAITNTGTFTRVRLG